MKLTIDTVAIREKIGDEAALRLIKETGFDGIDYSMCGVTEKTEMLGDDYKEKAYFTKKLIDELGLCCDQAHAPFTFKYTDTLSEDNERFLKLIRSVEYASIIGAKNLVIHYIKNDLPYEENFEAYNLNFFKSFIPYAKKFGVKISVENLYPRKIDVATWGPLLCDPEKHLEFIKKLDSNVFNICIDIGHSAVTGFEPDEVIRKIGRNLAILHIHDTDYKSDCHTLPYLQAHDWDKITKALADINYKGNFNLEVPIYIRRLPVSLLKPGLEFAHKIGREMIEKINLYR